jgi:NADPH2:quinone reductase
MMKAIQVQKPGSSDELILSEIEVPKLGEQDVLIEIKAIGVNFIDIYTRTGLYKPGNYPYTPGKEGSGVVVEVGKNVTTVNKGDRVAFCSPGTGSYAEFTVLPADQIVLIPESISFEIAAAAMLQGLTAYYLTHLTFQLKPNQTALIHAGAGGVGLLLIQIAKLLNAKVITTVSSADKAELAALAGADEIVIYTQESFLNAVMKFTNKRGVEVVYDSVGKTTFADSLKSLSIRGMLVSFGQSSGPVPPFLLSELSAKSLYLTRPSLTHYTLDKKSLNEMAAALFDLIQTGKLKITIGQRYALSEAAKAHDDLENRRTIGKSILLV